MRRDQESHMRSPCRSVFTFILMFYMIKKQNVVNGEVICSPIDQ